MKGLVQPEKEERRKEVRGRKTSTTSARTASGRKQLNSLAEW